MFSRILLSRTLMPSLPKSTYEFVTTVHPPSDRLLEYVALWSGKDIPAGIPMNPKLSLLVLNMRFLDGLFVFVGSNGHDHLSASSSTVEPPMTTALALDPT
jgi:hypothetical protein